VLYTLAAPTANTVTDALCGKLPGGVTVSAYIRGFDIGASVCTYSFGNGLRVYFVAIMYCALSLSLGVSWCIAQGF
jgi:hypothetical protein